MNILIDFILSIFIYCKEMFKFLYEIFCKIMYSFVRFSLHLQCTDICTQSC